MQRLQLVGTGELGMSRRLHVAAVACATAIVACCFLVAGLSAPAGARAQPVLVIREGAATVATFDGIPGNNPSSQEVDPWPSDCVNPQDEPGAGTFFAACDVIPLQIVPPAISEADDYFVVIDIAWEPAEQVDDVGAINDLDIYLYDNLQVAQRDDPESTTYTQFGKAASATQPEGLKVFRPDLGEYNLVVNNFSGPNVSYTVTARIETSLFGSPFEVLGPAFSGATKPPDDTADATAPVDLSGDTPDNAGPFIGAISVAAPALAEIAVLPDRDFLDFDTGSSFNDQLSAPMRQASPISALRPPAGPVASIVLVFWLVLLPLALGALVFFFVVRRSKVQITA